MLRDVSGRPGPDKPAFLPFDELFFTVAAALGLHQERNCQRSGEGTLIRLSVFQRH